jgi:hypothetical protein
MRMTRLSKKVAEPNLTSMISWLPCFALMPVPQVASKSRTSRCASLRVAATAEVMTTEMKRQTMPERSVFGSDRTLQARLADNGANGVREGARKSPAEGGSEEEAKEAGVGGGDPLGSVFAAVAAVVVRPRFEIAPKVESALHAGPLPLTLL